MNRHYYEAIPFFERAIVKGEAGVMDIDKLLSCYLKVDKMDRAESFFHALISSENVKADHFLFYGIILLKNNKVDQARKQFHIYDQITGESNPKAEKFLALCDSIKYWNYLPAKYTIENVSEINSTYSEFSPVFFKNSIAFVSDRNKDIVNNEVLRERGKPAYDIFYSTFNQSLNRLSFYDLKKFPWVINSTYNEGPISLNSLHNLMYFSRTQAKFKGVSTSKIFIARTEINNKMEKNKWLKKIESFKWNSNVYSVMHPSLSFDGVSLYFASDMPGGYGGMDIYVCTKYRGEHEWSVPQNLGPAINTQGNDVFPYIRKDGTLYYASDGRNGFGGLDIYSTSQLLNSWTLPVNIGAPINSVRDDFGIIFSDDNESGFFSSDRLGGKGGDDIYKFYSTGKLLSFAGRVMYSTDTMDVAAGIKLFLTGNEDSTVSETITDSLGCFIFYNIQPGQMVGIKIDTSHASFLSTESYYYKKNTSDTIFPLIVRAEIKHLTDFEYRPLKMDEVNVEKLDETDNTTFNIAGNLVYGDDPTKPLSNLNIYLEDSLGSFKDSTITNVFGTFVFPGVSNNKDIRLSVGKNDSTGVPTNTRIVITNTEGKEILSAYTDSVGYFKFDFLSSQKNIVELVSEEDTDINLDVIGMLLNGDGSKKGLPSVKVTTVDANGETIQSTITDSLGRFVFRELPSDKDVVFMVDENDPNLLNIKKLLIADENGKTVVEISQDASGKFRYKFLAAEKNLLPLMEVEDTQLSIDFSGRIADENHRELKEVKVVMLNKEGKEIQSVLTNEKGKFSFRSLPGSKDMVFSVDETDPNLLGVDKILLYDSNDKLVKEIVRDSSGKFRYNYLHNEMYGLSKVYLDDPWLDLMGMQKTLTKSTDSLTITENIYYETGKWNLLPEAKLKLNKIVDVMRTDTSIYLELNSHTDSRSSIKYNLDLSQKRAQEAVKYLISNGVDSKRVKGKGFGESKVINHCVDGVMCSEEEHSQNRRTEFKVYRKF